jgi:hypothetical protein
MPGLIEALQATDHRSPQENDNSDGDTKHGSLEKARTQAEFAQKECESGFPLLHAHTLVGLWGALEAAVEDLVVGILVNEPPALRKEVFAKVRLPLSEYERLEQDERMRFLVRELQRGAGFAGRQGIESFETILGTVDLSGGVDPEIKKAVWEAHHLRNVIVHRGSFADRRLVMNCPSLGLQVGDAVTITNESLHKYSRALVGYATAVVHRMRKRYGVNEPPTSGIRNAGEGDAGDSQNPDELI